MVEQILKINNDFPPPVDNMLFFGNCLLVSCFHETEIMYDLTIDQWNNIYENLLVVLKTLVL